jgi:hypothetical protein
VSGTPENVYFSVVKAVDALLPFVEAALAAQEAYTRCKFRDGICTTCGEPESGMCNGGEPVAEASPQSIRKEDTPENRDYWERVRQAAQEWDRYRPDWAEASPQPDLARAFEAGWHARCKATGKWGAPGDWETRFEQYLAACRQA